MIDRPLIYCAGAYRKPDPVKNTHRAIEVGRRIRSYGADVCIPHLSLLEDMVCPSADEDWLAITMRQCVRCDALFRIEGESEGSDAEVAEMMRLGRPVFYSEAAVADWVRAWKEQRGQ